MSDGGNREAVRWAVFRHKCARMLVVGIIDQQGLLRDYPWDWASMDT